MTTRVVTVGEMTLDDVVVEGLGCAWAQPGGGALYSAIGALAWGAAPALCATVGADYPLQWLERLEAAGIDAQGITRVDGPSLGVWLLHERGGRRHQIAKASGPSFLAVDRARRGWTHWGGGSNGVHVAPQTTEGQIQALSEARGGIELVTQDVMVEPSIDAAAYRSGEAIRGAHAFLPSEQEIRQIWGDISDRSLLGRLQRSAGVRLLVIKRGAAGADIVLPDRVVHVPTAADRVVDVTGAGDAFCGGFLVGLLDTGDPVEAAVRGSISAAMVVETTGAVEALDRLDHDDVQTRARRLRGRIREER